MTRFFSMLFALLLLAANTTAQTASKPLKKVMTVEMPGENGSNGASVVWHPIQKKYYASMAGNATFNFVVLDVKGKRLSDEAQEALFDVRGLWYDPVTKSVNANGYNEGGWIRYKLNAKGMLTALNLEDEEGSTEPFTQLQEGMVQPGEQSVGFLDVKTKRICFLSGSNIVQYSSKGEALDDVIELKVTPASEDPEADPMEKYNTSTVCYTGLPNAEFALLNYLDKEIELYNRKGVKTKAFKLPEDAPCNSMFNFAYANGIWWLFSKDERKWECYK